MGILKLSMERTRKEKPNPKDRLIKSYMQDRQSILFHPVGKVTGLKIERNPVPL